jgi:hypothetical protein
MWVVVNAVNNWESFQMEYPSCHDEQKWIAKEFKNYSMAEFTNCGGYIDGMLLCPEKPANSTCANKFKWTRASFTVVARESMG